MGGTGQATQRAAQALSLNDQIRSRAYELYVHRGNESRSELDDWLQAESEILKAQDEQAEENG